MQARLKLPRRGILLVLLLAQAVPNLPVYVNIARVFYPTGRNGTILGVVLPRVAHRLVLGIMLLIEGVLKADGLAMVER